MVNTNTKVYTLEEIFQAWSQYCLLSGNYFDFHTEFFPKFTVALAWFRNLF